MKFFSKKGLKIKNSVRASTWIWRESRPLLRSATLESDLRPPTIEVVLRCLEVVDGDLHIIDLAVAFVDPLRLLIELDRIRAS